MKAKSKNGEEEVELDKWTINESTGEKIMYSRLQNIPFCKNHTFSKRHECTKCPYVFTGFQAHRHIQKTDGIYDRKTNVMIVLNTG